MLETLGIRSRDRKGVLDLPHHIDVERFGVQARSACLVMGLRCMHSTQLACFVGRSCLYALASILTNAADRWNLAFPFRRMDAPGNAS